METGRAGDGTVVCDPRRDHLGRSGDDRIDTAIAARRRLGALQRIFGLRDFGVLVAAVLIYLLLSESVEPSRRAVPPDLVLPRDPPAVPEDVETLLSIGWE